MKDSGSGPLLIALAAFLWGLDGILRRALGGLSPISIVLYEHLFGLVLLVPFFWRAARGEKLTWKEWTAVGIVGTVSSVLGTLWFTTALLMTQFISFSVVFLIQKLQPIFGMATARLVLGERVHRRYFLWAAVALGASYFMTFPNGVNFATGEGTALAALFALGAAVAWGATTALSRYALLNHNTTFITGFRFAIGAAFAFVLSFFLRPAQPIPILTLTQGFYLLAIALSTGMVALWIYYRGLKHTSALVSAILELTFPLTAIFIDILLYHTVLSWVQYAAAAVLVFAMTQVTRRGEDTR